MPLIETSHDPVSPQWVYAIIGDRDGFFKSVDWAIERKVVDALVLATNLRSLWHLPVYKAVREDPRYVELFKKLNVPQ